MLCCRVQNLLSAYCDSELTGTEMLEIRAHLNQCRTCSREYAGLRQVKQLVGALSATEPRAPLRMETVEARAGQARLVLLDLMPVRQGQARLRGWLRRFRTELRPLSLSDRPILLCGSLSLLVLAAAIVRQPQAPDAVVAHVPELVALEQTAPPIAPASPFEALTSPPLTFAHSYRISAAPPIPLRSYPAPLVEGHPPGVRFVHSVPSFWDR